MPKINESFSVSDEDQAWSVISDLNKLVPCVPGGKVKSSDGPDSVDAEIDVDMGSMAMTFAGPVKITEKDDSAKRAKFNADTKEAGGQSNASGDVTIEVTGGECKIDADANVTGKASSMGEGTVVAVIQQLVKGFADNLSKA